MHTPLLELFSMVNITWIQVQSACEVAQDTTTLSKRQIKGNLAGETDSSSELALVFSMNPSNSDQVCMCVIFRLTKLWCSSAVINYLLFLYSVWITKKQTNKNQRYNVAVDTNTMLDRAKRLSSTQDFFLQELMQELDFYFSLFLFLMLQHFIANITKYYKTKHWINK